MITLQEISGYLPYEPLFSVVYIDDENCMTCPVKLTIDRFAQNYQDKSVTEFLLCLRPLSDLTKEIEVNGEKFVPIEKLKQNYIGETIGLNPATWSYRSVQKLFEWHFDIYNLIERDYAIDINTLK